MYVVILAVHISVKTKPHNYFLFSVFRKTYV